MKKILVLIGLIVGLCGIVQAQTAAVRVDAGQIYTLNISTEMVVNVSSTAVTTVATIDSPADYYFQNTGATSIMEFTVLSDSNTAGLGFLAAGVWQVENHCFTNYYFRVVAGSAASTLYIRQMGNK